MIKVCGGVIISKSVIRLYIKEKISKNGKGIGWCYNNTAPIRSSALFFDISCILGVML